MIPRLPDFGVKALAYEFARREDQEHLDKLVTANEFDVDLAKFITIKQEAFWGFKEYLDVFYLVWKTNQNLPTDKKIKILGLNDPIRWDQYNEICETYKRKPTQDEIKMIWKDCYESNWITPIDNFLSEDNGKILGFMGSLHAITKYRQPTWEIKDEKIIRTGFKIKRFGNYLYEKYGERVFNICFHDPWEHKTIANKFVQPANGIIEEVVSPLYSSVAFDLVESPFGELSSSDSIFGLGKESFLLKDFYDGYIYTGKIENLKPVTAIQNFFDETNFHLFKKYTPFNLEIDKTLEEVNAIIAEDALSIDNLKP